jgi:hypothetical protein
VRIILREGAPDRDEWHKGPNTAEHKASWLEGLLILGVSGQQIEIRSINQRRIEGGVEIRLELWL